MSLTSLLKTNPEMKVLFKTVPNLKNLIKIENGKSVDLKSVENKNPSLSKNPSLIGHSYDYFLQLHCLRINNAVDSYEFKFETLFDFPEIDQEVLSEEASSYLKGITLWNEDLTRQSIICGKLDQYHRSGVVPENILDIEQTDIDDLSNLINTTITHKDMFKANDTFISNPHFGGDVSLLVGGADADLIIDKNLIDIKVKSKIQYESYPWHQLLGYYVLNQLTENKEYSINRLVIWNPRYEIYMYIDIEDLNKQFDLNRFCDEFIKTLKLIHKNNLQNSLITKKISDVETAWENKKLK
jgi:hypothetical protein